MVVKDRKRQILELTEEYVEREGFDSFSYHQLSHRLGISTASLHYHFPKKEDLGVALCAFLRGRLSALFTDISNSGGSAWEKLESFMDKGKSMAKGQQAICPISSLQVEVNVLSVKMRQAHLALEQFELEFLTNILREGREKGEMNFQGEPQEQAAMVASTYKGAIQYARVHGEKYFQAAVQQLKSAMKSKIGRPSKGL